MDLTLLDHISRGTAPITIHAGQHGAQITLSRPALLERGARVAQLLANLGVEPGGRVVAFLPTGPAFLEVMLACWWSGLTFIPLPATSDRSTEVLRRRASAAVSVARPDAIVGTRASLAALEHPPNHARLIPDDALFEAPATTRAPVPPPPDQIAVMQFTSGSTGVPRGVQITHANMLANIGAMGRRTRMHRGDTMVSWLPLFHDMGLFGGLGCALYWDLALHLIPTESFVRNPSLWLRTMSDVGGTLSPNPTSAYDLLTRVGEQRVNGIDLSKWRYGWVGAEAVGAQTLNRFLDRFTRAGLSSHTLRPAYGLAEATLGVTMGEPGSHTRIEELDSIALRESGHAIAAAGGRAGSFSLVGNGPALDNVEVAVVDSHGHALRDRAVGHILVRGPGISSGYFGEPPRAAGNWLDTGDLGFLSTAELFITGRAKELIIRGGSNFSPSELEWAAEAADGVVAGRVAAFGGLDTTPGQELVILAVETRARSETESAALRAAIRRAVLEKVGIQVDRVVCVPMGAIPRTSSGKLRRDECRRLFTDEQLPHMDGAA